MYICNITGNSFDLKNNEKTREGGIAFEYNSRFRAIIYVFQKHILNDVTTALCKCKANKLITGIGMSDSVYANILSKYFTYTNTFFHQTPKLDINNKKDCEQYSQLDFVISSDVFEHISPYPSVQNAFDNVFEMLKEGGTFIFSVPYTFSEHKEHYPNLYEYKIIQKENEYILENKTIDGNNETFKNLVFHGGPGETLEMRCFSKDSIKTFMQKSGFVNINFHVINSEMKHHGIFWENDLSLIISCIKP